MSSKTSYFWFVLFYGYREHIKIITNKLKIFKYCWKSLLFSKKVAWLKKDSTGTFDITMGNFDGAETCELIRIYILYELSKIIHKNYISLYREDELNLKKLTGKNRWHQKKFSKIWHLTDVKQT